MATPEKPAALTLAPEFVDLSLLPPVGQVVVLRREAARLKALRADVVRARAAIEASVVALMEYKAPPRPEAIAETVTERAAWFARREELIAENYEAMRVEAELRDAQALLTRKLLDALFTL